MYNEYKKDILNEYHIGGLFDMKKYDDFYKSYLGMSKSDSGERYQLCISKYRDMPINKRFLYCGIITQYKNQWILSCSESYKDEIQDKIGCINPISIDDYKNQLFFQSLKVRKMYRFIYEYPFIESASTMPGTCYQMDHRYQFVYDSKLHKYSAVYDSKIVSYCKISDCIMGYGNVVIYTEPEHRNKGLATYLLNQLIIKCNDEKVTPMYLTDSENQYSILLAQKAGFILKSEEIILSKEI